MDNDKLKEINNLSKEIEKLDKFLNTGQTLSLKFLGKSLEFKRPNTYAQETYIVPEKIKNEVLGVLWKYRDKLYKEFESK